MIYLTGNVMDKTFKHSTWILPINMGPFYLNWLILIPAWMNNHKPSKEWNEIVYPFPNSNEAATEIWEWMRNFISHFVMGLIIYPRWDES